MRGVVSFVFGLALVACQSSKDAGPETKIPELSVPVVAELMKAKSATVIDVNNAETRQEYGVVPNALLLSNAKRYELSELPTEKSSKLVFYCGGTWCGASDKAAVRARQAGYSDVNVMRAGIVGWKEAGQAIATPRS